MVKKRTGTSSSPDAAVHYTVTPADPKGHYFDVVCRIARPASGGQRVALPAWIPGSYMVREFARNLVAIGATTEGDAVDLVKIDKHTWQAAHCEGALAITVRVYAWDPSVRAAHLDETHAFFNGTSLFLRALGLEGEPHAVDLVAPRGAAFRHWRVATTLPSRAVDEAGFGTYMASDYDALIDHPVEMGTFRHERFDAAGVPHEIAYTGVVPNLDAQRVNEDLAKICAAQIAFFAGPASKRRADPRAPFERYVFLTSVTTDGYGGLEHRASTALVCSREGLPVVGATGRSKAYRTFLGLASHEYFHSWNVKRIKPAAFSPYDLERENYTTLLWIFEGFTSYYDDLFLVRTGLIDEAQYLEEVAGTIDTVFNALGHERQSVAESSFDAWTKYYRPDENTPNAVVSYYKKGSLVALCLDLFIRRESRGKASLDDAMRLLWSRYGRDFYEGGGHGIAEDAFPALVAEATGVDVRREVKRWAYGTDALPLDALFGTLGLAMRRVPRNAGPSLGIRVSGDDRECRVTHVDERGPGHAAGLSAGDLLVAVDGLRVTATRLDAVIAKHAPGADVLLTGFRGDVLQTRSATLAAAPLRTTIAVGKKDRKETERARRAWLGD